MTTLAMMATYEKKRLKCYGTVAAGEHVAVTVTDGAPWIGEGKALRLRVLFGPDTVGVFPFADGDAWTATGTQNADAYCELNLNTLQAEKYLKRGGTCLWILDDVENHTLYATGEFDVLPWPKRRGIDEPIDLDGYPLLLDEIKDLEEAFEEYQRTVAQMLATKQDTIFDLATIRSGAAAGATAVQPSQIARFVDDAEYKAQYGKQNKPAILFKHGTNVIVALDATPFVRDGMVADVKIVGGNLVITFNTDSGKQPISIPLTDIFDPANYYDKTAVDNLLSDKQDALTFDNAPTSGSNNPVKSGGIWSAIWGALAALPTGFSSLYDWVVSQLAGKASTADATLMERFSEWAFTKSLTAADKAALYAEDPLAAENDYALSIRYEDSDYYLYVGEYQTAMLGSSDGFLSCYLDHVASVAILDVWQQNIETVATRTAFQGYQLGSQTDKPLASETEAEALRQGKLDKSAVVAPSSSAIAGQAASAKATGDALDRIARNWLSGDEYYAYDVVKYDGLYYYAKNYIEDSQTAPPSDTTNWVLLPNLAALAHQFLPLTGGTMTGTIFFGAQDSSYSLGLVYDAENHRLQIVDNWNANVAYLEVPLTADGSRVAFMNDVNNAIAAAVPYTLVTKTISNNTVALDDRAINIVAVSSALASLTVNFPTATSGKVRDFGLRLTVASGVTTAPQLVLPQGVTCENADGTAPEIGADGAATILYFTETASGVFLVKGEVVTAIS